MIKKFFFMLFFLISFFEGKYSVLLALDFSANWRYLDTSEDKPRWTQTYSLLLSSWATNALSTSLSLRYTRQDQGNEWKELYTPVLSLNLLNDWFNWTLSVTATENRRSDGPDISTYSWDTNLTTQYHDYNWRFYYGESSRKDDRDPRRIDDDSRHWGASVSKEWEIFNFFADYRGDSTKNHVERTKSDTDSYFLKGELSHSWNKFHYSLSQQFNYTKNDWKRKKSSERGKILIRTIIEWNLETKNKLKTDDYLIIDTRNREINLIIFYKDQDILEEISESIKWKIEWSDNKEDWVEIDYNVSLPYEFINTFDKGRYLKLTVIAGEEEINNPSIETYKYLPQGVNKYTYKTTNLQSNASLMYIYNEYKNISYNISYNENKPDPGKNNWSISQNISGYWFINKFLQTTTSFSMNKDKTEGKPSDKNYNFSINIVSDFLETLTTTTTYTHSLNKEGSKKISRSDTITLSTAAELYPDLEARWDVNYSHSKNYDNKSSTDSINTHINIIAHPKKSLTITGIYNYTYNKNKGEINNTTKSHFENMDITWRPSENFLMRASESIKWGTDEQTILNYTYSVWININPKIQTNFLYTATRKEGPDTDRISSTLSWDISQYLFFKTNYSWQKTDGQKQWSIMFSLNLNF